MSQRQFLTPPPTSTLNQPGSRLLPASARTSDSPQPPTPTSSTLSIHLHQSRTGSPTTGDVSALPSALTSGGAASSAVTVNLSPATSAQANPQVSVIAAGPVITAVSPRPNVTTPVRTSSPATSQSGWCCGLWCKSSSKKPENNFPAADVLPTPKRHDYYKQLMG